MLNLNIGQTPQPDGHSKSQRSFQTPYRELNGKTRNFVGIIGSPTPHRSAGVTTHLFSDPHSTDIYEVKKCTQVFNLLNRMSVQILRKFGGEMREIFDVSG